MKKVDSGLRARERLLEGLSRAIEERGYAAATIADVARLAGVSKRTFYEHFSDKEACFLELYVTLSQKVIHALREAVACESPLPQMVARVANAYLKALRQRPALTQAIFLELNAAGRNGLARRREVHERFAQFLEDLVEQARRRESSLRELRRPMALAIVGGINELVLLMIESGQSARLHELEQTASELILSVLRP